jgi:deaminated glutathione amidase
MTTPTPDPAPIAPPRPGELCAAVVQLCSREDVEENLARAGALVREAARRGATLVVLPENFAFLGPESASGRIAEELVDGAAGRVLGFLSGLARELGVHLLAGGTPERTVRADRHHNTALLLAPDGRIAARYRKIHLFDAEVPAGPSLLESRHVEPGAEPVVATVGDWVLGLSICYDLRFPELYRRLVELGATILAVPAAFTLQTGKDHWFPLLRARAIENQCYVLAAAQHGAHSKARSSYGKACIIDPWGAVVAQVPDKDGVALAVLERDHLERIRRDLPCLGHRRLP